MILQTNYTLTDLREKPSEITFFSHLRSRTIYVINRPDKNRIIEQIGFILFTTGSYSTVHWTPTESWPDTGKETHGFLTKRLQKRSYRLSMLVSV